MTATQDRAAIAGVSRPRIGPWIQVAHHKRTSACFIHARLCDCPEGSGDTGHTGDCSYHGVWWHGDAGSTCDQAAIAAQFAAGTSPTSLPAVFAGMSEYVTPREKRQRGKRNAGQFAPRKAARAFRAVLPSWALAAFTVCLAIPGPLDEAMAVLTALVLLVVRFPGARSAWRGGKSHRKAAVR